MPGAAFLQSARACRILARPWLPSRVCITLGLGWQCTGSSKHIEISPFETCAEKLTVEILTWNSPTTGQSPDNSN